MDKAIIGNKKKSIIKIKIRGIFDYLNNEKKNISQNNKKIKK